MINELLDEWDAKEEMKEELMELNTDDFLGAFSNTLEVFFDVAEQKGIVISFNRGDEDE